MPEIPKPMTVNSKDGLGLDRGSGRQISGVKQIVLVASGKGGVGKSTISVNLATGLARSGLQVGLLDADLYGPSIPKMLALHERPKVSTKMKPVEGADGMKVMSFGFLMDTRDPLIWRGPMLGKALRQMCFETDWAGTDVLVIDLPPGTGDVQLSLLEMLHVDGAVIVTTPQDIALLDVQKGIAMFERHQVPLLGLVENMSIHVCRQCGFEDAIFGSGGVSQLAAEKGVAVLGRIPLQREVQEAGDSGQPMVLSRGAAADALQTMTQHVSQVLSALGASG